MLRMIVGLESVISGCLDRNDQEVTNFESY
ncbi:hypothetical protein HF969_09320 [Facklamia miroungae]|nr:hypothetical protein [Facklamia miroungae]